MNALLIVYHSEVFRQYYLFEFRRWFNESVVPPPRRGGTADICFCDLNKTRRFIGLNRGVDFFLPDGGDSPSPKGERTT